MKIVTIILDVIILILNFIVKKTKATWDDAVLKAIKVIRAGLRLGGFKK